MIGSSRYTDAATVFEELEAARRIFKKYRFKVIDVTHPDKPKLVKDAFVPLKNGHRIYIARTYAYVAAGEEGLAIIDVEKFEKPKLYMMYNADGTLNDARDVVVASTNATAFAYVADGKNGLKVVHLTAPDKQPLFYGFSPAPVPVLGPLVVSL